MEWFEEKRFTCFSDHDFHDCYWNMFLSMEIKNLFEISLNFISPSFWISKKFNSIKHQVFYKLVEQKRTQQTKTVENHSLNPYQKRNLLSQKFNFEHNLFDELIKLRQTTWETAGTKYPNGGLKNSLVSSELGSLNCLGKYRAKELT